MSDAAELVVEVADVFVAYASPAGTVMALRGADLSVRAGERLLVQGPNGSGKSTLLRVITGQQAVLAGSVRVGESALDRMGEADRRRWRSRHVGFVDQHARRGLLPELDVLGNVALQMQLTGSSAESASSRAAEVLDDLGLAGLAGRSVPELSGGEAQRVALCAAVAHGPRLVLADEPAGELDDSSARAVHRMLGRLAAGGASVVLVSHDQRSVDFASRTVRVRSGRVAEEWDPGGEVTQVPDRYGWVRLAPELWPHGRLPSGVTADAGPQGVLLRPGAIGQASVEEHPRPVSWARSRTATPAAWGLPDYPAPWADLEHVSAGYGGPPVLSSLTLRVDPGEWVAVTGASGSGKSTLLSLVAGTRDPDAGVVRVGGTAWPGLDRSARARHRRRWVALSPQRPSLVEALTVAENLELTRAVREQQASPVSPEDTADRLGLMRLLRQPVHRLSGGERQRVALARCLVSGAPLLVLDEPTSQQDEASAAVVAAVLRDEVEAGRAVLVASHDSRLIGSADRTVRLGAV